MVGKRFVTSATNAARRPLDDGARAAPSMAQAAAIIRSTSATISRRWMGLDSTLAPARRALADRQGDGGEAGDEHDAQAGWRAAARRATSMPSMPGMTMSVKQQVPDLVQRLDGLFAVGAGGDLVAGALQRAGQEAAQGIVVFGKQNARHGRWSARSGACGVTSSGEPIRPSRKLAMNRLTAASPARVEYCIAMNDATPPGRHALWPTRGAVPHLAAGADAPRRR